MEKDARMTARRADRLAIVGLALGTVLVTWPLLTHPLALPPEREHWFHLQFASFDRLSIVRYGQFPFRCPYLGGGFPNYLHPDDLALSPRMLLVMALGPWASQKVDFALTMFLAAVGTYLLVRRQMGQPVPAALVSAITFAFGGFMLQRWLQGWLVNARPAIFPLILYCWYRAFSGQQSAVSGRSGNPKSKIQNPKSLLVCGLMMGWMLLDAKYGLAVLVWFIALWMVLRLDRDGGGRITDRIEWRRFAALAVVVVWAFGLAAMKLVPFAPLLWDHYLQGGQGKPISWPQVLLWGLLFAATAAGPMAVRLRDRRRARAVVAGTIAVAVAALLMLCPYDDTPPAQRRSEARASVAGLLTFGRLESVPGWSHRTPVVPLEESSPVGLVGAALAAVAVVARPRRVWRWTLLAGLLMWIDLGQALPLNLQQSVWRLPGLNALRNPLSWFNVYLLFTLAVLAGHGASVIADCGLRIADWLRGFGSRGPAVRRLQSVFALLTVGVSLGYLVWVSWPRYTFTLGEAAPPRGEPEQFHMVREGRSLPEHTALLVWRNVGVANCGKDLNWTHRADVLEPKTEWYRGAPNPRYRDEVYFRKPEPSNQARITKFTPLEIRVAVDVKETPADLVLNQLADANWRTSAGTRSRGSTLGARLTQAGAYEVTFRYVPTLFYWGLAVTIVSLIGGPAVIFTWARRRSRVARARSPAARG